MDGIGRAPLASACSPEVAGVDVQLKYGDMLALDRTDLNVLEVINQRPYDSPLPIP